MHFLLFFKVLVKDGPNGDIPKLGLQFRATRYVKDDLIERPWGGVKGLRSPTLVRLEDFIEEFNSPKG